MSEPDSRRPRINLRPTDGPPPARRATDRHITWGFVTAAFCVWGFVALLVMANLVVPWEQLDLVWMPLHVVLWVFVVLFAIKGAFMTWSAGGLVRIWMHYRGRRRR